MTLTFAKIASESAERLCARGFERTEHVSMARDQWDALYMNSCTLRRYGDGSPHDYDKPLVFHGPGGRIHLRPDDTLAPGSWVWFEPSPFERWFPTLEAL